MPAPAARAEADRGGRRLCRRRSARSRARRSTTRASRASPVFRDTSERAARRRTGPCGPGRARDCAPRCRARTVRARRRGSSVGRARGAAVRTELIEFEAATERGRRNDPARRIDDLERVVGQRDRRIRRERSGSQREGHEREDRVVPHAGAAFARHVHDVPLRVRAVTPAWRRARMRSDVRARLRKRSSGMQVSTSGVRSLEHAARSLHVLRAPDGGRGRRFALETDDGGARARRRSQTAPLTRLRRESATLVRRIGFA